ncbi:MAG: PAS-domain containing protein [Roseovarius sp.]|nr:PAS-domain containing protein [Roseovarius sp.]
MSVIDASQPPEVRLERQERIIAALMRRADRQNELSLSAYSAFQSAIELQAQVAAKTRDLERAASELESMRGDRERTRRNLHEALSAMHEGFALFTEGRLDICNDLFRNLLPDIAERVKMGLSLDGYFELMVQSRYLVSTDRKIHRPAVPMGDDSEAGIVMSILIEISGDIWYQLGLQRTSSDNVVLLLTDITPIVRRNRSERKTLIDRQADYLQAVFEHMSSGVCTFSPEGAVMMQNRQFRHLLDVPISELGRGTTLERLLAFMQAKALIRDNAFLEVANWREQLKKAGWLRRRVRHGKGRVLDVQANTLPDGGFLVELKDVTLETRATEMLENRVMERTAELTRANARLTEQFEQKARVEEELRLAKERAEAAVSSKTRFLAAASHDLLQPINAAKLLISTLQEAAQGSHLLPMVDRLHRAFSSTEQLLHALLDISRLDSADPDAVTPSEVNLGAMMESVFADQLPLAEAKGVRLDVVPAHVFVRSDPVYLHRSIQNLVVNAIQYTEAGGRVLLGARRRGACAVLEVWDTGIGIRRADQARIFDEFARAGEARVGTGMGLGLSVVDRACRHLGHALGVRSAPGRGSVFSIAMEVMDWQARRGDPVVMIPATSEGPFDHDVLVIENDADVLFAFAERLRLWGARVTGVGSGAEALARLAEGVRPDIVLADYHLDAGATGLNAVAALRDICGQHLPAILVTANRSEALRREAARADIAVISKPVKLSHLRPLIDWAVRHGGDTDKSLK